VWEGKPLELKVSVGWIENLSAGAEMTVVAAAFTAEKTGV
jgi:hypothetical protein